MNCLDVFTISKTFPFFNSFPVNAHYSDRDSLGQSIESNDCFKGA